MNIIILGDKYQKRMKSRGCVGLIRLKNNNIFDHQYKTLKKFFPKAKIIYIYGFESKKISSFFHKNASNYPDLYAIYNKDYETHNYAYSLSLADKFLNDDCLVLFGDNIVSPATFKNFKPILGSQIFINQHQKNKLGCIINNTIIENISYDLDNYLSEIYFISKPDCLSLKLLLSNRLHHNYFIFEIINKMLDSQRIKPFYTKLNIPRMKSKL